MSQIADYHVEELQAGYEAARWLYRAREAVIQCDNCGYFNRQQAEDALLEIRSLEREDA